jgi:hypothetical protein
MEASPEPVGLRSQLENIPDRWIAGASALI